MQISLVYLFQFALCTAATFSWALLYNDDYADGGPYEEGVKGDDGYAGNGDGGGHGGGGGGKGGGGGGGHAVDGAINSKHTINTYAVKTNSEPAKTPIVDINSGPLALKIRFNSHSSNIDAIQQHFGSPGQVKKSSSVDQPDILFHSVKRPVIQEIKEIVTPYRKRIQEIKPAQEKIETIIATGHGDFGGNGGGGGGGGYHGGYSRGKGGY